MMQVSESEAAFSIQMNDVEINKEPTNTTESVLQVNEDLVVDQGHSKEEETTKKKKGLFGRKKEASTDPFEPKNRLGPLPIVWTIGPIWILVVVGALAAAVGSVAPLAFFSLMGELLTAFATLEQAPSGSAAAIEAAQKVSNFCGGIIAVAAIAGISNFLNQLFNNIASELIGIRLKKRYFEKVVRQEIAFFDYKKTGIMLAHLGEEIQKISEAFSIKVSLFIQFLTQAVVGIIMAFVYAPKMAAVMVAFAPLLIVVLLVAGWLSKVFSVRITKMNAECVAVASEVLSSMRTVRSMGGEHREIARYTQPFPKIGFLAIGKGGFMGFAFGFIMFTIWSVCSLAFWYGSTLIQAGELGAGDIFTVFGVMMIGVMGLSQSFGQIPEVAKGIASANEILKIILRKPQIKFDGGEPIDFEKPLGKIEFKDITFAYPTRPNVQVLKKFNLDVEAGLQVALVGASGSGKSTIVGLLERFYEPKEGQILIDGVDIKTIDPFSLHKYVGIVTQEPTLFATTIRQNIAYARPDASMDDIIAAAKAANAYDFIMRLPLKFETLCGERGVALSGGQKQRIAIARILVQDPKVLLLDEATSALDTTSEAIVQDAINKLMKGRTSIVIAHRLATIRNADRIVVMQFGEIVEMGTHDTLLSNPQGVYTSLASKQMLLSAADAENMQVKSVKTTTQETDVVAVEKEEESAIVQDTIVQELVHHGQSNSSSSSEENNML